jgi:DNA-binding NarL/FixJ family response regulator
MQTKPIHLAIVDDQSLFRSALKNYLSGQSSMEVVIQTSSIRDFLLKVKNTAVDVLLVDLFVPGTNGNDAVKAIRNEFRNIKILVLSTNMDTDLISDLLDSGIHGYISKADEPEELLRAIRIAAAGQIYQNKFLTEAFYRKNQDLLKNNSEKSFFALNDREKKLLRLVWEEKSNKEIAEQMHLGVRSVEKLRQELKEKIGAKSTIGMIKYAIRTKIIKWHFLRDVTLAGMD